MFSNWLKRKDNQDDPLNESRVESGSSDPREQSSTLDKEEEELTSLDAAREILDQDFELEKSDDDYFYYYYYVDEPVSVGPTIPLMTDEEQEVEERVVTPTEEQESLALFELQQENAELRELLQKASNDQSNIESLREKITLLDSEFAKIAQEYADNKAKTEQELLSKNELIATLNTQLDDFKQDKETLTNLKSKLSELSESNLLITKQFKETSEELASKDNEIKVIQEQLANKDSQIKKITQELTEEKQALQEEVELSKQTISKLEEHNQAVTIQDKKEEKEQEKNLKLLEQAMIKEISLHNELANLRSEKETLETRLVGVQELTSTHSTEMNHLKELLLASRSAYENEQNVNDKLSQELNAIQEENQKLVQRLDALAEEKEGLNHQLGQLQTYLTESQTAYEKEQLIGNELSRELSELEAEIEQMKEIETDLTRHYEEKLSEMSENKNETDKSERELADMNEKLEKEVSQREKLEKELAELRDNQELMTNLEKEIMNMKTQQQTVATSLAELSSEKEKNQKLAAELEQAKQLDGTDIQAMKRELDQVKTELRIANDQLSQAGGMNQSDIAQVMLEAQARARQIVEVANYEAKRKVSEAETELSVVSQEARNYYRKLTRLKAESEVIFSDLLRKLDSIGNVDRLQ